MVSSDGEDASAAVMRAVSVRDSAVVARGADEHGPDAVALWRVNQHCLPTGAHVGPGRGLCDSPGAARRRLGVLGRPAITARMPRQAAEIVDELTASAKIDGASGGNSTCSTR